MPHPAIDASDEAPLECVAVRSRSEAVVVSLGLADAAPDPGSAAWVDPIHAPARR